MKKLLFILTVIALLLTGCGNNQGTPQNTKLQTGTKGLSMSLLEKGFQKEVFEDTRAYASLQLQNEGYYNIQQGVIVPSLEQDFVEIESWQLPYRFRTNQNNEVFFDLLGKSLSNSKGEKQVLSAVLKTKRIDDSRNKMKTQIIFNACYSYATVTSQTICIDTDPNDLGVKKKSCKAKDISPSGGQGGPVAITSIQERVIPADSEDRVLLEFTIYAENQGDGTIINYDNYREICEGRDFGRDDYNVVKLHSIRFSDYEFTEGIGTGLECSPTPMKEIDKKYYTKCTITKDSALDKSTPTYETPLIIDLVYGYKTTISQEMEIMNDEQGLTT
jgi:hypothetical protein